MKYKKGNWIEHPAKNEWGRGYVIEVAGEEEIKVFFEQADKAIKTLVLAYVQPVLLHPNDQVRREWIRQLRRRAKFPWPTTNAPIGIHGLGDVFKYKEGLLSYVGYRVGNEGEPERVRQSILDWVFHNHLPNVKFKSYMLEWGDPESVTRLRKMAQTLAALTRNNKRNTHADYSVTIQNRESDLKYLYEEYYVGRFQFVWPSLKAESRAKYTKLA